MTLRVWFKKVPQLGDMVQVSDSISKKINTVCFDGNIRMLASTFKPNENWAMNSKEIYTQQLDWNMGGKHLIRIIKHGNCFKEVLKGGI